MSRQHPYQIVKVQVMNLKFSVGVFSEGDDSDLIIRQVIGIYC